MNDQTRLPRRLLVLRVGTLAGAGAAVAACVSPVPGYHAAPLPGPMVVPVVPRGTGITDADPGDSPGFGRGGPRGSFPRTGITDADPGDSPGFGRGGRRW